MSKSIFEPSPEILELAKTHQIQYVNAEWDEEGIYFYQAYKDEIANYALEHQKFGGPCWGDRMTWIKPSFAWMLYRCGYGRKHNQNRVLKIKLGHEVFRDILKGCNLTIHLKHDGGKNKKNKKDEQNLEKIGQDKIDSNKPEPSFGRIQWDPERDLYSSEGKTPYHQPRKMLKTRAIQIGINGGLRELYVENVISIEEVTDLAKLVGEIHLEKDEKKLKSRIEEVREKLPNERPYWPALNSEEELKKLGMFPGDEATSLFRLGKGKTRVPYTREIVYRTVRKPYARTIFTYEF